jgi:hypothetical protein
MSDQPKLCRDCKFVRPTGFMFKDYMFARCGHPTAVRPPVLDLVAGEMSKEYRYLARTQRESQVDGDCGKDAIHFEERP